VNAFRPPPPAGSMSTMTPALEQLVREAMELTGANKPSLMEEDMPVLSDQALTDHDNGYYLVGLIAGKDVGKSALVNALVGKNITPVTSHGAGAAHIAERFVEAYRAMYGQVPTNRPIEIVTLRVRRMGKTVELKLPTLEPRRNAHSAVRSKLIESNGNIVSAETFSRSELLANGRREGPLLLIDPQATAFIPPNWTATAADDGAVIAKHASE